MMFHFTKEERTVLISLAAIIVVGACLNYLFKTNPQIKNMVNVLESDHIYRKIDINQASQEDLVKIPRIGPVTAQRIIFYRNEKEGFKSLQELQDVEGIGSATYKTIVKYLKISP
ncbi:MAG: helix-hairpin-helix domain-containing protein [Candidatus Aceula meridiana]|nr:helix-hairpin-helix domain-containing protein [Candidatus Aceula meridiana]